MRLTISSYRIAAVMAFPFSRLAAFVALSFSMSAGVLPAQSIGGAPGAGAVVVPRPHRVIDLTHTLDAEFPHIPVPGVTFPFALEPIASIEEHGVAANAWRIHEHLGTQIDAPNHFATDGVGLHALSVDELLVPAVVIDFRARGRADPDVELLVADILAWEARFGRIPPGSCVILYTGWDLKLPDAAAFLGLDTEGTKHFPGIAVEAARFLAEERSIWGVGTDAVSFDPGVDDTYATHRALLGAGKWALEALANVRYLPPSGAVLFVGAPKVRDATGGPVRAVALTPSAPNLTAPSLAGQWESVAPERIDRADGTTVYVTRRFTFRDGTWRIRFSVTDDADGQNLLFAGDFGGPFEIGTFSALSDAFEARFFFSERVLTAGNESIADALTAAGCGRAGWEPDVAQDVHEDGCEAFRVYPVAECDGEHDLVRRRGDRLFFGSRPSDGNLCSPSRRPIVLGNHPVVRRR